MLVRDSNSKQQVILCLSVYSSFSLCLHIASLFHVSSFGMSPRFCYKLTHFVTSTRERGCRRPYNIFVQPVRVEYKRPGHGSGTPLWCCSRHILSCSVQHCLTQGYAPWPLARARSVPIHCRSSSVQHCHTYCLTKYNICLTQGYAPWPIAISRSVSVHCRSCPIQHSLTLNSGESNIVLFSTTMYNISTMLPDSTQHCTIVRYRG